MARLSTRVIAGTLAGLLTVLSPVAPVASNIAYAESGKADNTNLETIASIDYTSGKPIANNAVVVHNGETYQFDPKGISELKGYLVLSPYIHKLLSVRATGLAEEENKKNEDESETDYRKRIDILVTENPSYIEKARAEIDATVRTDFNKAFGEARENLSMYPLNPGIVDAPTYEPGSLTAKLTVTKPLKGFGIRVKGFPGGAPSGPGIEYNHDADIRITLGTIEKDGTTRTLRS